MFRTKKLLIILIAVLVVAIIAAVAGGVFFILSRGASSGSGSGNANSPEDVVIGFIRALERADGSQAVRYVDVVGETAFRESHNSRAQFDASLFDENYREASRDIDRIDIEDFEEEFIDAIDDLDVSDFSVEEIYIRDVRRESDNSSIHRVRARVDVVVNGEEERLDLVFYTMERAGNHYIIGGDGIGELFWVIQFASWDWDDDWWNDDWGWDDDWFDDDWDWDDDWFDLDDWDWDDDWFDLDDWDWDW
ncbi:MAG: hypothetical protein FWC79_00770 [Oscillospiraceae bacterium]|nr:hypothetical protein [Oscillospiraceae bacterium]